MLEKSESKRKNPELKGVLGLKMEMLIDDIRKSMGLVDGDLVLDL